MTRLQLRVGVSRRDFICFASDRGAVSRPVERRVCPGRVTGSGYLAGRQTALPPLAWRGTALSRQSGQVSSARRPGPVTPV